MQNRIIPPIRVVVAEDDSVYRELLREQLRLAPDLDVIGEARDGREAVAAVGRLKPDILTLDLDLPGMNGLDVLYVTRWCSPDTKVIIISGRDEESIVQEALRQGAKGYVVKGDGTDLKKTIRVVHDGEVWARRQVLTAIIAEMGNAGQPAPPYDGG
ncbi:MAG: response regulator transcription factor [candidate division NC10 bacterium]|nr:response regulator transcription factor [candidate division NC10 bacterium]